MPTGGLAEQEASGLKLASNNCVVVTNSPFEISEKSHSYLDMLTMFIVFFQSQQQATTALLWLSRAVDPLIPPNSCSAASPEGGRGHQLTNDI